jgi:FAD synthase
MELQFMARLRDEMMFEGLKALQDQLQQDAHKARSILATEPVPVP